MRAIAVDILSDDVRVPVQVERWPPEVRWGGGKASIIIPFGVTVPYARSLYDLSLWGKQVRMRATDGRYEGEYTGMIGNLRTRIGGDVNLLADLFVSEWPTETPRHSGG